jgi:hypothetical protein
MQAFLSFFAGVGIVGVSCQLSVACPEEQVRGDGALGRVRVSDGVRPGAHPLLACATEIVSCLF